MTFATVIEFIVAHWKAIGLSLIISIVGIYIMFLKHDVSKDAKLLTADQQTIAVLQSKIDVQNEAIIQMQKYADQKQAEIASATTLAEKMQDTVDAQAKEIELRKTVIEGQINTLADCKAELDRIKNYMVDSENQFKQGEMK